MLIILKACWFWHQVTDVANEEWWWWWCGMLWIVSCFFSSRTFFFPSHWQKLIVICPNIFFQTCDGSFRSGLPVLAYNQWIAPHYELSLFRYMKASLDCKLSQWCANPLECSWFGDVVKLGILLSSEVFQIFLPK